VDADAEGPLHVGLADFVLNLQLANSKQLLQGCDTIQQLAVAVAVVCHAEEGLDLQS